MVVNDRLLREWISVRSVSCHTFISDLMQEKRVDANKMAPVFKALSHPNRLHIYREILHHWKQCVQKAQGCALNDISHCLSVGAPTVSHHVKALVKANLIRVEKQGKRVNCHLNEAMFLQIQSYFLLERGTRKQQDLMGKRRVE